METKQIIISNTQKLDHASAFGYDNGEDWIQVHSNNAEEVKAAAEYLGISEKAVKAIAESLEMTRTDIVDTIGKDLIDIWKKVNREVTLEN